MTNINQGPEDQRNAHRQLSTEELEKRLSMGWLARNREDEEYFDKLAEVVMEREAEDPCGRFADVDASWEKMKKQLGLAANAEEHKTSRPAPKCRQLFRRAASFAAAIATTLACLIVVQASGVDIFGALGKWTDEVFRFAQTSPAENMLTNAADVLPEIEKALLENGIPTSLAPKGDMAGMRFESVQICRTDEFVSTDILLSDAADNVVSYAIFKSSNASFHAERMYEKEDAPVMEYIHNGMRFYIFENAESATAVWSDGTYSIMIVGNIDCEILQRIIDCI